MTGRRWSRDGEATTWTSRIVGVVVTVIMFVVSFVAMTTMRSWRLDNPKSRDEIAVVRFTPPAARVDVPKQRPPVVKPPSETPTRVETPPEQKRTDTASAGAPTSPARPGVVGDSGPPGASNRPMGRGAAPVDGGIAGINLHPTKGFAAPTDSLARGGLRVSPDELKKPLTSAERSDLRARMEPGLAPNARAARLPGDPVYAPLMNGGYAVGVSGISIAVGRTHAKEKALAAKLDSEFMLRLAGFQLRIQERKKRDSVRADSLRQDSLRRLARP